MDISARVGEVPPNAKDDIGKGEARIDSKLLEELGIESGEPVKINGEKDTVARAVESFPADEGLGIVRMDGYVRKSAGLSLGDSVKISTVKIEEANTITLAPAEEGTVIQLSDAKSLKKGLSGRYVTSGDIVVPSTRGSDSSVGNAINATEFDLNFGDLELLIHETFPDDPVKITEDTEIQMRKELPDSYTEKDKEKHPIPESQVLYLAEKPSLEEKEELADLGQVEKLSDSNRLIGCYETDEKRIWMFYDYYFTEDKHTE
jgi:transitional endoplasmic reticulum ATPase